MSGNDNASVQIEFFYSPHSTRDQLIALEPAALAAGFGSDVIQPEIKQNTVIFANPYQPPIVTATDGHGYAVVPDPVDGSMAAPQVMSVYDPAVLSNRVVSTLSSNAAHRVRMATIRTALQNVTVSANTAAITNAIQQLKNACVNLAKEIK